MRIENHLKKLSQFLPEYTTQSITMQSTNTTQSTMHFPQYHSIYKWFPLECAYYSMVIIALVYNSGSQNGHVIKPGMEMEMKRNEMKRNRNCVCAIVDF